MPRLPIHKNLSLDNIYEYIDGVVHKEIWRDIPAYKGLYQASSMGRIKILKRSWIYLNGVVKNTRERILAQTINPWGYLYVELSNYKKERKKYFAHVLIARAHIPNPLKKPSVNHIEGVKSDNRVIRLEWATRSENSKHAFAIGLRKPVKSMLGKTGLLCPSSRPVSQYTKDGIFVKTFVSQRAAAKELGISAGNISSAVAGVTYKSTGGFIWKNACN